MDKIRVGVIMGGKSIESEVSFNSGRTVCDHLDTITYDIIPLFQTKSGSLFVLPWHFLHRGKTTDFEHRLVHEAEQITWDSLKSLIDFMFIAMPGKYAEDGILQGMLEVLSIPYLGSKVLASALSMDKIIQKKFLDRHGIKTPKAIFLTPAEIMNFDSIKNTIPERLNKAAIKAPYLVKPSKEGSSLGITKVHDIASDDTDLRQALIRACTIDPHMPQSVLIEEVITGMEFACTIITDTITGELRALPPTEVIPEKNSTFFDFQQKYMPGRAHKRTPPACSAETITQIQKTCIATMNALGLTTVGRIDGFVTHNQDIIIIDPNSLPGLDPASFLFREAAEINMSHSRIINHLIETELIYYNMTPTRPTFIDHNSMNTTKKRIAILLGGDSNEKEISLASGRNITYKLSLQKYDAIPLFVTNTMELYHINQSLLVRNTTQEIQQSLDVNDKINWHDLPAIADFVFIALHGGKGENGAVQGTLEMLGMPYNGSSVLASGLCMDKYKTAQFLHAHGFDIPSELLITQQEWRADHLTVISTIEQHIPYSLIVKPSDDGCSIMVEKITTQENLITAIETIFAHGKSSALIEEFVVGMELTVGVIGNDNPYALPPSQTVVQNGILSIEEKFLPGAGENQTPAPLPPEALVLVQKKVTAAYVTAGCTGYARIDCFYQSALESPTAKERVIILEINTLPGMTPATCIFHQAAEIGVKPIDFIDQIIILGFEKHQNNTHSITDSYNKFLNTITI